MAEQGKKTPTEKKKDTQSSHYVKLGLTIFLTTAACITFAFVLFRFDEIAVVLDEIVSALEPIIIGLVLAYLLMPVKNFIESLLMKLLAKTKLKDTSVEKLAKGFGILGAIVFLFLIIAGLVAMLVPALVTSVAGLLIAMPGYVESFVKWMQDSGIADNTMALFIGDSLNSLTETVIEWAQNDLLPLVQEYLAHITSGVFAVLKTLLSFVIGIIVMVYVMSIRDNLVGQCKKIIYAIFPAKKGNIIIEIVRKSNKIFSGFISGKLIDSAIIGVIAYIGCLIMNTPSAILVAFIIGVTNVIPFFGPFIGAIPTILLVLIQSPIHALYLAIFILVLQQIDGNIIGPKILGENTGLASFWVLFSILVSGSLFGFAGMVLGVPTFAVIYYITQQLINYRIKKKKLSTQTKDYVDLVYIDEKSNEIKYNLTQEEKQAK